jgi:hypothetical protein
MQGICDCSEVDNWSRPPKPLRLNIQWASIFISRFTPKSIRILHPVSRSDCSLEEPITNFNILNLGLGEGCAMTKGFPAPWVLRGLAYAAGGA